MVPRQNRSITTGSRCPIGQKFWAYFHRVKNHHFPLRASFNLELRIFPPVMTLSSAAVRSGGPAGGIWRRSAVEACRLVIDPGQRPLVLTWPAGMAAPAHTLPRLSEARQHRTPRQHTAQDTAQCILKGTGIAYDTGTKYNPLQIKRKEVRHTPNTESRAGFMAHHATQSEVYFIENRRAPHAQRTVIQSTVHSAQNFSTPGKQCTGYSIGDKEQHSARGGIRIGTVGQSTQHTKARTAQ